MICSLRATDSIKSESESTYRLADFLLQNSKAASREFSVFCSAHCTRVTIAGKRQKTVHSRFLDLSLELSELGDGQLSVLVVVEALDEVQRSLLGVVELGAQYVHRLIESDEVAA